MRAWAPGGAVQLTPVLRVLLGSLWSVVEMLCTFSGMSNDQGQGSARSARPARRSRFAVPVADLEGSVQVPLEEQVTEIDPDVPRLPSDAEQRRATELRVITHGA